MSRRRTRRRCGSASRWRHLSRSSSSARASRSTCWSRSTTRIPTAIRSPRRCAASRTAARRSPWPATALSPWKRSRRVVLEALADEARHLLEEGVVDEAADIDTCLLLGAGWPFFLGGITKHLDQTGVSHAWSDAASQTAWRRDSSTAPGCDIVRSDRRHSMQRACSTGVAAVREATCCTHVQKATEYLTTAPEGAHDPRSRSGAGLRAASRSSARARTRASCSRQPRPDGAPSTTPWPRWTPASASRRVPLARALRPDAGPRASPLGTAAQDGGGHRAPAPPGSTPSPGCSPS